MPIIYACNFWYAALMLSFKKIIIVSASHRHHIGCSLCTTLATAAVYAACNIKAKHTYKNNNFKAPIHTYNPLEHSNTPGNRSVLKKEWRAWTHIIVYPRWLNFDKSFDLYRSIRIKPLPNESLTQFLSILICKADWPDGVCVLWMLLFYFFMSCFLSPCFEYVLLLLLYSFPCFLMMLL